VIATIQREHLDWDSRFFGLRIGRVLAPRLDTACAADTRRWFDAERLDCAYLLMGSDDPASVRAADEHGFRFIDIRLTLDCPLAPDDAPALPAGVRPAKEDDVPALQAIARRSHRESRFHSDPRFEHARCDELYAAWIANSYRGRAKVVLVAEDEGRPVGYLAVTQPGPEEGQIDLLAVADTARGRGHGARLVAASLHWCAEHALRRVRVVTQGRNVEAQRLYQAAGFRTRSVELWYHRWR
jgi:ribosomal protein S18 acetylase RimI-like enzyme